MPEDQAFLRTLTLELTATVRQASRWTRWFQPLRKPPWWGHVLMVVWAIVAATTTAANPRLIDFWERQSQVAFFRLRGAVAPPSNVVVLAIDEYSLSQTNLYRSGLSKPTDPSLRAGWPLRRATYAKVIDRLLAAGAKVVAIDVLFPDPSSFGPADDAELQRVLERYKGRITLPANFEEADLRQGGMMQLVEPYVAYQTQPGSIGTVNFWPEPNGRIQRLGNQFTLLLAQAHPQQAEYYQSVRAEIPSFAEAVLRAARLPYQARGGDGIFYYGPQGTFETISFWHVLEPENWGTYLEGGRYFKDRIVLIGPTAETVPDFLSTPFGRMAGVEIHANAIATLANNQAIRPLFSHSGWAGLVVLVGVLGAGWIQGRFSSRPIARFARAIVLVLAWGGVSYVVFTQARVSLPTTVPMAAIGAIGVSYLVTGFISEHLKKLQLHRTLKQYAGAPLVREILSQQDDLQDLLRQQEVAMMNKKLGGRYQITRLLGSGGFGETYIAEDSQRPGSPQCVVKHLRPVSNNPKLLPLARRLFQREAETLEKLGKHDQIPQLLAYFEEDAEFYLVQEFIPGQPLSDELSLGRQLPEARVIVILKELLEILDFIHRHGVIHRDIKPSNIIQRKSDNRLVLIDFGAVKEFQAQLAEEESQSGLTVGIGTQGYMPNEQCAGSPRFNSDIYALGMTAIQALVGLPPSQLKDDPKTGEILWQERAQVSQGLSTILAKMVRYDHRNRYATAVDVLQDLKKLADLSTLAFLIEDLPTTPYPAADPATSTRAWPETKPWPETFGPETELPPTEFPPE